MHASFLVHAIKSTWTKSKCIKYGTCWQCKKIIIRAYCHLMVILNSNHKHCIGIFLPNTKCFSYCGPPLKYTFASNHIHFYYVEKPWNIDCWYQTHESLMIPADHDGAIEIHWLVCFPMAVTNVAKLGSWSQIWVLANRLVATFCTPWLHHLSVHVIWTFVIQGFPASRRMACLNSTLMLVILNRW